MLSFPNSEFYDFVGLHISELSVKKKILAAQLLSLMTRYELFLTKYGLNLNSFNMCCGYIV